MASASCSSTSTLPTSDVLTGALHDADDCSDVESSNDEYSDANIDSSVSDVSIETDDDTEDDSDDDQSPPTKKRPAGVEPKGWGAWCIRTQPEACPHQQAPRDQPAPLPQPPFQSRDGTIWDGQPSANAKAAPANIFTQAPGPKHLDGAESPASLFNLFISVTVLETIVLHTNAYGLANRGRQWVNVTMMEIRSTIGLLLYLGLSKISHARLRSFWTPGYFSRPLCQSVMSGHRFQDILTMMRFDDRGTQEQRKALDKFAPIREVFDSVVDACRRHFLPGECLTIDEQLLAFRGRCSFKQFVPSKPAKYGIKMWACVDSSNNFVCNMQPCIGKHDGQRKHQLGARVVNDLMRPYFNTGRNVTADKFFVGKQLAIDLLAKKTTVVGTIKSNRREVPDEFKKRQLRGREAKTSVFAFSDMLTIVSFVHKKFHNVTLLTTKHHDTKINPTSQKPYSIEYYNSTKASVDTVNQLSSSYNCARITKRWPMVVFYHLLNISSFNAYVLWCDMNPNRTRGTDSSLHGFIQELVCELLHPQLEMRAANPRGLRRSTNLALRYLGYDVTYPRGEKTQERGNNPEGRCYLCPSAPATRTTRTCSTCRKYACKQHCKSERKAQNACDECAYLT